MTSKMLAQYFVTGFLFVFVVDSEDIKYGPEIVAEVTYLTIRGQIITVEFISSNKVSRLEIVFWYKTKKFVSVVVTLNDHLISDNYIEREINKARIKVRLTNQKLKTCYYDGHIKGNANSTVALSLCGRLSGFISMDGILYSIDSVEHAQNKHEIVKIQSVELIGQHDLHCDVDSSSIKNNHETLIRHESEFTGKQKLFERKSRYLELHLINDISQLIAHDNNVDKIFERSREIAHFANIIFQSINIYIVLVGVDVMQHRWNLDSETKLSQYFNSWIQYKDEFLVKILPNHDTSFLIINKLIEANKLGISQTNSICKKMRSGGIISDLYSMLTGPILAHELGHTLGIPHDTGYQPFGNCECSQDTCLMNQNVSVRITYDFSSCSEESLLYSYQNGIDICLENYLTDLRKVAVCGNGIVELGEGCDCGKLPIDVCNDTCCDEISCELLSQWKCASGHCCDLTTCDFKANGSLCRQSKGECDFQESCNGVSAVCPPDRGLRDGQDCGSNSYCFDHKCIILDETCSNNWGRQAKLGSNTCFEFNAEGSLYGNCGVRDLSKHKYEKCKKSDAFCGLLFCNIYKSNSFKPNLSTMKYCPASYSHRLSHKNKTCSVLHYNLLGRQDPGYVPNGAPCGPKKMCFNRKCVDKDWITSYRHKRFPIRATAQQASLLKSQTQIIILIHILYKIFLILIYISNK